MIDFGMPTLIELSDIEACAKLCSELGLKFVELNMNLPECQIGRIEVKRLKEIAECYHISYTIHLDENTDICNFNPLVREAYVQTVQETIALAKELNIPVINMHLTKGVYFTLPEQRVYLYKKYCDEYFANVEKFRELCENEIGESGIKICIENSDGFLDFQIQTLDRLLKSKVFALTFDIGHNHGMEGRDEPIILDRVERLCHFHFHDALGRRDHLALGTGEIELMRYFKLAEQVHARVVLETKTVEGLRRSVEWVKTNYRI